MTNPDTLPQEIKWRGSTYQLVSVEGDKVNWTNPVSRHSAACSVETWKRSDPYDMVNK